jgi:hypothetical protein
VSASARAAGSFFLENKDSVTLLPGDSNRKEALVVVE